MKYEPLIPKPGVVHCKANKETMKCEEINVFLGDPAFAGGVPLYSTMLHEYEHVKVDVENPKAWIEALDRDGISPEELAVREFAGYAKEIMNLYQTGVIKDKKGVKHLGKMLKEKGWDDMSLMDKSFHKELYESCLYQVRCSFFGMLRPYRYIANNHHLNRAGRAAG